MPSRRTLIGTIASAEDIHDPARPLPIPQPCLFPTQIRARLRGSLLMRSPGYPPLLVCSFSSSRTCHASLDAGVLQGSYEAAWEIQRSYCNDHIGYATGKPACCNHYLGPTITRQVSKVRGRSCSLRQTKVSATNMI